MPYVMLFRVLPVAVVLVPLHSTLLLTASCAQHPVMYQLTSACRWCPLRGWLRSSATMSCGCACACAPTCGEEAHFCRAATDTICPLPDSGGILGRQLAAASCIQLLPPALPVRCLPLRALPSAAARCLGWATRCASWGGTRRHYRSTRRCARRAAACTRWAPLPTGERLR